MSRNAISVLGFAAVIAMFALVAIAAPSPVVHDDPPRPLDARYHELPEALVKQLRAQVPPRPYAFLDEACFTHKRTWHRRDLRYCVCYNKKACDELAASGQCSAKLAALAPGVGVCRADFTERVIVVG